MTIASDKTTKASISIRSDMDILDWDEKIMLRLLMVGNADRSISSNQLLDELAATGGTNPLLLPSGDAVASYTDFESPTAKTTATDTVTSLRKSIYEAKHEFIEILRYYRDNKDVPVHKSWVIGQFVNAGTYGTSGTAGLGATNSLKATYYVQFLNVLWQMLTSNAVKKFSDLKQCTTATFADGAAFTIADFFVARTAAGASNGEMASLFKTLAYLIGSYIKGSHTGKNALIPIYIDPTKGINVDYLQIRSFYKFAHRIYAAFLVSFSVDNYQVVSSMWSMYRKSESDNAAKYVDLLGFTDAAVGDENLFKRLFRSSNANYDGTYLGINQLFTDTSVTTLIDLALTERWKNLRVRHHQVFSDLSKATYGANVIAKGCLSLLFSPSWRTAYATKGPIDIARALLHVVNEGEYFDRPIWNLIDEIEGLNIAKYVKEYIDPILDKFAIAESKASAFQGFMTFNDIRFMFWKEHFPLTATTRADGYISATTSFWSALKVPTYADFDNIGPNLDWVDNFGQAARRTYNLRIIGDDQIAPKQLVLAWFDKLKYRTFSAPQDTDTFNLVLTALVPAKHNGTIFSLVYKSGAAYWAEVGLDNLDLDATYRQPDILLEAKTATYSGSFTIQIGQNTSRPELIRWDKNPFVNAQESDLFPFDWDMNPGQNHYTFVKWIRDLMHNASPSIKEELSK